MARDRRTPPVAAAEPILHFAARVDDAVHELREKRARKRGYPPTVIPYAGYGGPGWIRVLCRIVLKKASDDDDDPELSLNVRGWRNFMSVPLDEAVVFVEVDGVEHQVTADRGGIVDARIDVELTPGWQSVSIRAPGSLTVEAPIFVVDTAAGFGVVSDIDDTVMVTSLPRPFLAAWNTFVVDEHARRPVPGMAVLYERLTRERPGAPVVYLSTGAWNVAPALTRFLSRNLYPRGPLLLTDWGPTQDRWFRSGADHKRDSLARLAREFPEVRWLLVGDDGQHDEQLYADFSRAHPDNVVAVAIRQLSKSEAVLAGGRSKGEEHERVSGIPWVIAPDGAGLIEQLRATGRF